jgi:GAF domain-containing protein
MDPDEPSEQAPGRSIVELQVERLGRLQELTAALSAAISPAEVIRAIFSEGVGAVGAQGAILYWESESGELELVEPKGALPERVTSLERPQDEAPLPSLRAYRSGQPVWLESQQAILDAYPALAEEVRALSDQAWVGLPLAVDASRGALGLRYAAPRAFDGDERAFVVAVSRLCTQALERASLFARQQVQTARLTALQETTAGLSAALTPREVGAVIFRGLLRLGVDGGALFVLSQDGLRLERVFCHGTPVECLAGPSGLSVDAAGPAADAVRRARPVFLDGPEAVRAAYPALEPERARRGDGAWAAVPLVVEGRTVGALTFALAQAGRLGGEDRLLAVALAQQGAQALERARLFESQAQLNRRMASMHAAAAALSGAVTTAEVAAAVVRALEPVGAAVVELFAIEGGERLRRVAGVGVACAAGADAAPLHVDTHHPVSDVVRTGKALWLESGDAFLSRWPHLAEERARAGLEACAVLPLLAGGRTLGVLLAGFTTPRAILPEDRSYLRLVALPCAAAMERAVWRHPTPLATPAIKG